MAHSISTLLSTLLLSVLGYHLVSGVPIASHHAAQQRHPSTARTEILHGRRSAAVPAFNSNFADPSIFQDTDGQWYAFATEGNGKTVQVARAPAVLGPWELLDHDDLLPTSPSWATGKYTWAPAVDRVDDGSYVMYYSAQLDGEYSRFHGIGTATADSVLGPYTPSPGKPFAANVTAGGAIDASGFRDGKTGKRYVVYKVDGNSLGSGGSCGNVDAPVHPTPIMLQEVEADGVTRLGGPTPILDRTEDDGPLVEAPSLLRMRDGRYVLFYSSGCFNDASYRTNYAIASEVTGPYVRAKQAMMKSGDRLGLAAPGGAAAAADGSALVFHADCPQGRCMHVSVLNVDQDDVVTLEE